MKPNRIPKSFTWVCFLLISGSVLMAQSKAPEEKAAQEAELKAKKEMLEQQEKVRQLEREYAEQARDTERMSRESDRVRTLVRSSGTSQPGTYYIYSGDEQNSESQLTLRNSFNGGSDQSTGEFDVDEHTRHIRCMITGKVKSGTITVKITYPGGKVFKELTINKSAEITFSQSLTIKEEENDKYIGSWKYEVKADKAEGNYTLQFMTH